MQNLHIPVTDILPDRLQLVISNYIVNSIVFCYKSRSHRLYSAVLQDIITFNTIVNSIVNSTVNTHLNTLSTSPLTPALSYEITVIDNQTIAQTQLCHCFIFFYNDTTCKILFSTLIHVTASTLSQTQTQSHHIY